MADEQRNIGIESPGFNAAVVRKDDDGWKFLVLQRAQDQSYPGFWGFVTGNKEGDETVAQAVYREMVEETGIKQMRIWASEYLVHFYEPENDKIWILPLIVVVVPEDSEVRLSPENQQALWLPAESARHRVSWRNLVVAISDLVDELDIYPAKNWVEIKP